MKSLFFVAIIVTGLSACNSTKVHRNYKHRDVPVTVTTVDSVKKYLAVSAFVLDPASGTNKLIFDLSDHGQAALTAELAKSAKNNKDLIAAMASPIKEAFSSSVKGNLLWKKRVVLNVLKLDKETNNRVERILFELEIPAAIRDKVEFVSWDKIATETVAIDLGKITETKSTTMSITPSISMLGAIQGTVEGGLSNTFGITDERPFTIRQAPLNAALISKNKMQVFRQSVALEDISGNIVIELTMKSKLSAETNIHEFSGLFNNNVAETNVNNVALVRTLLVRPDFGTTPNIVPIDLTYDFRYRKVTEGLRTGYEYDDRVTPIDGLVTEAAKFNIFDEKDTNGIKTWSIKKEANYLYIEKNGIPEVLQFDDIKAASQLLSWISITRSLTVAGYTLKLGSKNSTTNPTTNLTTADIAGLSVTIDK